MAKARRKLTDRLLASLKRAASGNLEDEMDSVVSGFGVRISPDTGRLTFILRTRYPGWHHPTRRAIGEYGAVSLAEARETARDWLRLIQEGPSQRQIGHARDAYDDCVADLDEQLGRLIDELDGRPILGPTWVIITADHGESFGERARVFRHGGSLYQTEVHVPLVVVPPLGAPTKQVVDDAVSLRDLAATVVVVVGLKADSPFPEIGPWRRCSSACGKR